MDPKGWKAARKRNPTSWNLYAYAMDDPVNHTDPTGTTCVPQNGSWADDGSGCGYVGQPVSPAGSFNPNTNGSSSVNSTINFTCALGLTGSNCNDPSIYGWIGLGQQVVQRVGQLLNSVSVGGFVYAPLGEASAGVAEGSVLLVKTQDSNAGSETSVLGEVGVGPVAVGYEQNLDTTDSDVLGFVGFVPGNGTGIDAGVLTGGNTGTFGFFFGIGDTGVGIYISFGSGGGSNLSNCQMEEVSCNDRTMDDQ